MEVFFNELSIRAAHDEREAKKWLVQLAEVGQLLKRIVESIQEDAFVFRRKEDFGEMLITKTASIREFLTEHFDFSDPEPIFLLGIFDTPYITADDPLRSAHEYTSLSIDGIPHGDSGLAAAYIKGSIAISLNSAFRWDTCNLALSIERLNTTNHLLETVQVAVEHASQKQHIVKCHLHFLSELFNWPLHRPRFDTTSQMQTLLPMLELYTLLLDDGDWETFHHNLRHLPVNERVARIETIVGHIAQLQRWEPAVGSLAAQNSTRTIFIVPHSNLIIGVDTQHGEFEVHRNQKGNNHLGTLSFDGKRFGPIVPGRSLQI